MPSAPREATVPLTRWQYFTKNLYRNAANETQFTYNKVIYNKSEALQEIERRSARVNAVLLLLLLVTAEAAEASTPETSRRISPVSTYAKKSSASAGRM